MARIINFYVPASYCENARKQVPEAERGKVIDFVSAVQLRRIRNHASPVRGFSSMRNKYLAGSVPFDYALALE